MLILLAVVCTESICEADSQSDKIVAELMAHPLARDPVMTVAKTCGLIPAPQSPSLETMTLPSMQAVARALHSVGETQAAVDIFRMLSYQTNDTFIAVDSVRLMLGTQLYGSTRWRMFGEDLLRAVKLADSHSGAASAGHSMLFGWIYQEAAKLRSDEGDFKTAAELLKKAIQSDIGTSSKPFATNTNDLDHTHSEHLVRPELRLYLGLIKNQLDAGDCQAAAKSFTLLEMAAGTNDPCVVIMAGNIVLGEPLAVCVHDRVASNIVWMIESDSIPECPDFMATAGLVAEHLVNKGDKKILNFARKLSTAAVTNRAFAGMEHKWRASSREFAAQIFLKAYLMTERQGNAKDTIAVGEEFLRAFPEGRKAESVLGNITMLKAQSQRGLVRRAILVGMVIAGATGICVLWLLNHRRSSA